jgi:hypothetical protein
MLEQRGHLRSNISLQNESGFLSPSDHLKGIFSYHERERKIGGAW